MNQFQGKHESSQSRWFVLDIFSQNQLASHHSNSSYAKNTQHEVNAAKPASRKKVPKQCLFLRTNQSIKQINSSKELQLNLSLH